MKKGLFRNKQKQMGLLGVAGMLILCLLGQGCGQKKLEDMAEDTPWNHGYQAIMETEEGYYMNYSCVVFPNSPNDVVERSAYDGCRLYYYEKQSGVDILLCNKPECQHNGGDNCEATYRFIRTVNTALYEGNLYILGLDVDGANVSLNLYRAALDGSSIDKVGTVIQGENLNNEAISRPSSDDGFLLHKGYAYIPYYLRFGKASKTFMGGGLCKMNIRTGEKEDIYVMENVSAGFPEVDAGVGDFVYYSLPNKYMSYRYVISENRVEETTWAPPEYPDSAFHAQFTAFSKQYNYLLCFNENQQVELMPCHADTGIVAGDRIAVDMNLEERDRSFRVVCYEDKLMVANSKRVLWYSNAGEKLAELAIPFEGKGEDYFLEDEFLFRIHDNKLYLLCRTTDVGSEQRGYDVYFCRLEELFAGQGEWEKAFVIKDKGERLSKSDQ